MINECDVIIGNESGPICIGAALNKKVYSLYSKKFSRPESKPISKKIKLIMITIIIVVYKSDIKKLNNILKKIGNKYKIILIDKLFHCWFVYLCFIVIKKYVHFISCKI